MNIDSEVIEGTHSPLTLATTSLEQCFYLHHLSLGDQAGVESERYFFKAAKHFLNKFNRFKFSFNRTKKKRLPNFVSEIFSNFRI